jgi:hypothetical protein
MYKQLLSVLVLFGITGYANAADIVASSCTTADVQTAVNAAVDGDRVLIPNGSCSWTSGISTTKQIIIQAQNYTPTPGGTMTRNVTITNNAGTTPLFSLTSGNSYHVGFVGIRFNDGSGTGNYLRFSGSGTKVPLLADCSFEYEIRYGDNPTNAMIAWLSSGGVIWNTWWASKRTSPSQVGGSTMFMDHPRAWNTASTMGQLDTNGIINVYVENSTGIDIDAIFDVDQGARLVVRNNYFDGTWFLTHGFTSGLWGAGRHVEIYDNTFRSTRTDETRNLSGRYFWLRAGTMLATGNDVAGPVRTQDYGSTIQILNIGDNTSPSGSDAPMQPGWGHDGTNNVRDPMYVWGNTGAMGSAVGFNNQSGNWQAVTIVATSPGQVDGELFVNLGAKPGWSRYTYPHPARAAIENTTPDTTPPTTPTNLIATAQSSSQINLSWTASTDDTGIAGYDIRRCSGSGCTPSSVVHSTTGTGTTWNNTGLSASTLYRYDARARDAVPNYSSYSTIAQATTTEEQLDTTAPATTIASPVGPATIYSPSLLVTGTATDAVGVVGCKWRRTLAPNASNGTLCTGTTSFSCSTSGYSQGANTLYVGCFDAAGNYGSDSMVVNYYPPLSAPTNLRIY